MKILREDKNDKQCRIEEAVYYANGGVILLSGAPHSGYKEINHTTLDELEISAPDNWGCIYETNKYEGQKYCVVAGETSYGGAGFVALYDKELNEYIWLIHLNQSNNFISVTVCDNIVIAVSDYSYPNGTEFRIPIEKPELFEVSKL